MTPHQQQTVEEYKDLLSKLNKLHDEIISNVAVFETFDIEEQSRLSWQLYYMGEYAKILKERIEASA